MLLWRNRCIAITNFLLPILLVIIMSIIPTSTKTIPDIVPTLNFTIPDMNFLWDQAQNHKLCYDNNLFARCGCEFPDMLQDIDVMPQYALDGLVYPIESLFQTMHGSNTYFGLCGTAIFLLQQSSPVDCDAVNDKLNFCPRYESMFVQAFPTCDLVSNGGAISNVTEGENIINTAIAASHGIAIPDAYIDENCQDLYFGIAPLRQNVIDNGGGTGFASPEEEVAFEFYTQMTSDLANIADQIIAFATGSDINNYVTQSGYGANVPSVGGAIVFNSVNSTIDKWDYSLRVNHTREQTVTNPDYANIGYYEMNTPVTAQDVDIKQRSQEYTGTGPQGRKSFPGTELYYLSGLLSMQQYVDQFILSHDGTATTLNSGVANFPTEEYKTDGFWSNVGTFFSVLFVIIMLIPVGDVIKQLVLDKELRLKEGMMQMGLHSSVYWSAWITNFFTYFFLLSIAVALCGLIKIFQNSNVFYIFLFFFLFFTSTVFFCIFISSFFSKARTASTVGILVFLASFFVYFAVDETSSTSSLIGACVLPATCMAIGTIPLSTYEDFGVGITSSTLFSLDQENISFGLCIVMFVFDTVLYCLLAWYVTQVIPSEWGTNKPWYFCCDPRFLFRSFCGKKGGDTIHPNDSLLMSEVEGSKGGEPGTVWVEKVPTNLLRQVDSGTCISIRNLKKVYNSGNSKVYAVGDEDGPGLSITMFKNQITALLGHNGAGKSTTMHMLSGMTDVTYGDAYVFGKSVKTDMDSIRQDIGVCPQHDILYDNLTCLEHLKLFAVIKGVPSKEVDEEAESMLAAVGLTEKLNEHSKTLSGGQKRKLSVGLAFIGGSTTIILDEPTSGMDPHSRRFTWDLIRKMKQGRVVFLTTHFMDEADLLGDRIAIMSQGRLECCGSSLFLKRVYGVGYSLTLVKEDNHESKHGAELMELMKNSAPDVTILSDVGKEISLQLPQATSSQFPTLLTQLDERLKSLLIASYGLSVTTLEEVFLKVAQGAALKSDQEELRKVKWKTHSGTNLVSNSSKDDTMNGDVPFTKEPEFKTHVGALLTKRSISLKREPKMQCFTIIAPVLFVLLGLGLLLISVANDQEAILLSPNSSYNTGHNPAATRNPFFYTDECVNASAVCSISEAVSGLTSQDLGPSTALGGTSTLEDLNNHLFSVLGTTALPIYGSFAWGSVDFGTGAYDPSFQPVVDTNITGLHAAPIFMNALSTSWLRGLRASDDAKVDARIHPLPLTVYEKDLSNSFQAIYTFVFISIAFAFIPAAWVGYIVREREYKAKHLQIISGVSLNAYWISTYLWDTVTCLIVVCLLTVILIVAFKVDGLVDGTATLAVVVVFILWTFAATGFAYVVSFFFETHGSSMTLTLLIHIGLGFISPFITYMFLFFESTYDAAKVLKWILRIFPSYAMGDALLNLSTRQVLAYIYAEGTDLTTWSWNVCGADILYLAVFIFIYAAMVIWLEKKLQGTHTIFSYISEWKLRRKLRDVDAPSALWDSDLAGSDGHPPLAEDEDIIAERQRVQQGAGGNTNDVIELHGLRKAYPINDGGLKIAVRDMWLRVSKGECFGFLGTNGAGKTTTISMIVGEQESTLGETRLDGTDVKYPEVVHRLVGYTPQFDALISSLTGREHLVLYGNIKGIKPRGALADVVDKVIEQVGITQYADRVASTYSGGNRRKLSVGIALLGSPPVIILDEPSTGVDPVARHFLWNMISNIVTERKEAALILTTHLMEECEAISNRIGIMVDGRLRCLGSAQHLKERYGMGYQLEMTLGAHSPEQELEKAGVIASAGGKEGTSDLITSSELRPIIESLAPDMLSTYDMPGGPASLIASMGSMSCIDLAAWMIDEETFNNTFYFLMEAFEDIELKERQGQRLRFNIDRTDLTLAKVFTIVEENREELNMQEYMLGQTSLENIFNSFASTQLEEKAPAPGTVKS